MFGLIKAANGAPNERIEPPLVTLEPKPQVTPSAKPPVRIFLGTEDAQYRAERIFFYSIERHRDPARRYEIHLMKNLAGFDRRWWRTGFTNYRFAIPSFAGAQGKAIYNDVDQVYLEDPAALFDLEMKGHGYLSVSAEDTSVMLVDCERMAHCWNREAARRRHKHLLLRAASRAGLWGALEPGWNARDLEYREGDSKLLHFTALHLQPWRPTPERYAYRPHPVGEVWHRLEREADAAGYRLFTMAHPSPCYHAILQRWRPEAGPDRPDADGSPRRAAADAAGSGERCWRIGVGDASRATGGAAAQAAIGTTPVRRIDLAAEPWPDGQAGIVLAEDCLERLPAEDVPWALDALFARSARLLCIVIRQGRGQGGDAAEAAPYALARTPQWWRAQLLAIARHHERVAWQLDVVDADDGGVPLLACGSTPGRVQGRAAASVCLLLEGDPLCDAAGRRLAEILAGAWDLPRSEIGAWEKDLLDGAVPCAATELIVSCGPRGARAALHLRGRDPAGGPRLIHLGRPGVPFATFDLIVARSEDQLPLRGNVLHLPRPLSPLDAATLEAGERRLAPALAELPRPLIGVLAGGGGLDRDGAARLGRMASARARAEGGALLLAPHPACPAAVAEALSTTLSAPAWRPPGGGCEPGDALMAYAGCVALADAFIVSSDAAMNLACACAQERPVSLFEAAPRFDRRSLWLQRLRGWLGDGTARTSYRGTPRQQDWRGRLFERLIAEGRLYRTEDPRALAQSCLIYGLAEPLEASGGGEHPRGPSPAPAEALILHRVQELMDHRCI